MKIALMLIGFTFCFSGYAEQTLICRFDGRDRHATVKIEFGGNAINLVNWELPWVDQKNIPFGETENGTIAFTVSCPHAGACPNVVILTPQGDGKTYKYDYGKFDSERTDYCEIQR